MSDAGWLATSEFAPLAPLDPGEAQDALDDLAEEAAGGRTDAARPPGSRKAARRRPSSVRRSACRPSCATWRAARRNGWSGCSMRRSTRDWRRSWSRSRRCQRTRLPARPVSCARCGFSRGSPFPDRAGIARRARAGKRDRAAAFRPCRCVRVRGDRLPARRRSSQRQAQAAAVRSVPAEGSGMMVLGMGKLGAHELNFSSDIDLIVFVDPFAPAVVDPLESVELFSRLTRRLVRILQDRTEHGYVFRTDLRLQARSRLDAARGAGRGGAHLLRGAGPELGARGDDQGPAGRRRPRRRCRVSQGAGALCLAQIHGLCGDRRRPFDQAPDPCAQGAWRDRGPRTQRQARARRHPRDRVLRADAAADRRRPLPRPARPRNGADAGGARRRMAGSARRRATG